MFERSEARIVRVTKPRIRRPGAITVLFWIVLAATSTMAQQGVGTVTGTDTTHPDLNGRDAVGETVVTHRSHTHNEERFVIETYLPSEYPDSLILIRRVSHVTTLTQDGLKTVDEAEERDPGSPSETLRLVRRSVTTLRQTGIDSYATERQVFEADGNGRLVLVPKQMPRHD
jgi:hypothetical protein